MIWQAINVGFGYFQREATPVPDPIAPASTGRETGQWHEADLAVAHWLQHTYQDTDMQLHVHSQIAHTAKTGTDGEIASRTRWGTTSTSARSPRSSPSTWKKPSPKVRPGMDRPNDEHGFEIKGISGEMIALSLPARIDHRRPARPRGTIRAAVRPRAIPARTRAPRASLRTSRRATRSTARWILRSCTRAGPTSSRAPSACRWVDLAPSVWHEAGRATARGATSADRP